MRNRLVALLAGLAVLAAACGTTASGGPPDAELAAEQERAVETDNLAPSPPEDVPSALEDMDDDRLPEPLIPEDEVISGGPPPDGIPSIDDPTFVPTADVTYLEDDEPVLFLEIDGDARAYPIQVLIWHEIVNDTVGDVPVAVTFCPLCNSALAFDRRLGDRILDFGTSGMLHNSALVMYDRQTESLWSHFTGDAFAGALTGEELEIFPMATVSWADFRDANPDGLVLSRSTGFERPYGNNPYPGYDNVNTLPFLFDGEVDGQLAAKERVVGIEVDDEAVAVQLELLSRERVLDVEIAGQRLVVWLEPGTASALESSEVADGRDVGATGVFVPVVDGEQLHFTAEPDGFVDAETGSTWNVLGEAVAGPLAGRSLDAVPRVDTFWFAWSAFHEDTELIA